LAPDLLQIQNQNIIYRFTIHTTPIKKIGDRKF